MTALASALLAVMGEIAHLQSDKQVGQGSNAYKGLSDQKATGTIRKALIKHGVIALQSSIEEETTTQNWIEESVYNGNVSQKAKIQVFTRVKCTITLIHAKSGETATIQAIGHGIDNGDKAAGKAMTYAKKNALLNSLLISSGLDADDINSDDLPTPPPPAPPKPPIKKQSPAEYINTNLHKVNDDQLALVMAEADPKKGALLLHSFIKEQEALAYINANIGSSQLILSEVHEVNAAIGKQGAKEAALLLKSFLNKTVTWQTK